jgi:hypothetical protein
MKYTLKLNKEQLEAIDIVKFTNPDYTLEDCLNLIFNVGCFVFLNAEQDKTLN